MAEGARIRIKVMGSMFGGFSAPTCTSRHEFIYDASCDDYDWFVVFDELPVVSAELRCPAENTILCTWEPVSIKSYSKAYTRQFGHLLTNRPPEAERHPHYHLGRGYFPWFVREVPRTGSAVDKPHLISTVCSAKQMKHTQHYARYQLVATLAKEIDGFDWFGFGVKPLEKKYEALDAYKYHVTVENHVAPHHWTEKFADAILCECLPFYAGDPAIGEIFPADCCIPISMDDPAAAAKIVRESIANDEYEKRRPAILEAKRLMLEKYNFADQVIAIVAEAERAGTVGTVREPDARIYARKTLRLHSLAALMEDAGEHLRRFFRRG